jgi:Protein of unknown function (DUF4245)
MATAASAIGEDVCVVMTGQGAGAEGKQRANRRHWILAPLTVLAIIAAVLLLTPRTNDAVRPTDYSDQLAQARAVAPYKVVIPVGLGPGWTVTSAQFSRYHGASRWHLGLIAPGGDTVGIEQSDGDRDKFVDLQTGNGRPEGVLEVNSLVWSKQFAPGRGLRSLVRERGDSVVVLAGLTEYPTLTELARALRAN